MRNSRNTVQRALVLHALRQLNHPNADEIYAEIQKERPNVSRGTVYRNLNLLSDNGAILRISMAGGADRFDYQTHNHCHLYCERCRRVHDIDAKFPEDLHLHVIDPRFKINSYTILYNGLCPDCADE